MNKLLKTEYTPPLEPPAISGEAEERRNSLALAALKITAITSPETNETARSVAVQIRDEIKATEAERVRLTKPALDWQKLLMSLSKEHSKPLQDELSRLERLGTVWLVAEETRVAAELKARLELAAEAKTDSDFAIISNEAMPEMNKASGQSLRRVMKIEVTDILALAKARPELVKMEPNLQAIKALLVPESPNMPPGLLLRWENASTYSSR